MIEVLQVGRELEEMTTLYRERRPRRVLEVGTWEGGTLREWLAGEPELVVAVDLVHRRPENYPEWTKPSTDLVVVEGDSAWEDVKAKVRELAPYDWLYIDGDHGEGYVRNDVSLAIECAAPGALLLLHDIVDQGSEGPRAVFDELARSHEAWEYVHDLGQPWAHGIGVVQLP